MEQQKPPATQQSGNASAPDEETWTVRRILEWTTSHLKKHGSDTPRLDAEILLAHARNCQRIQLYTDFDQPLNETVRAAMRDLVKRRSKSEPVAYLVGRREFFSLGFRVTPDVLIPRPDTETLVLEVLEATKPLSAPRALDLCTGSGCVAIAVAKNCPAVHVVATDISAPALEIAKENSQLNKVAERIEFIQSDLLTAIPAELKFDVIASNPPYVPTNEINQLDKDVALHEPRLALDGGPDGLLIIRRLINEAPRFAVPNGWLMIEFSPEQADAIVKLIDEHGAYEQASLCVDLAKRPRVIKARLRQ